MSELSRVPTAADPPSLESLRNNNYALYETLKSIMQLLRDIIRYLKETETRQIVP